MQCKPSVTHPQMQSHRQTHIYIFKLYLELQQGILGLSKKALQSLDPLTTNKQVNRASLVPSPSQTYTIYNAPTANIIV